MRSNGVFNAFDAGSFTGPDGEKRFSDLAWNRHPVFDGVALKHLLDDGDSGGLFSYHLVRIEPGKAIGRHIHDPQLETHEVIAGAGVCVNGERKIAYRPGVVSVFPSGVEHEVAAGDEGLLLFAKFMPPLV